ncbi:hypothetical protein HYALB_00000891 [Hymenoscyphus albidus]|uniref:Protein kinase domain-containing protein n=1 Tax=Hymenoscyphus albidus TaxID=595503 RepID=A0A9N9LE12_9HELO|nr:hypothetical protein HYALB_00000891 [Hymenoscyphus albidus]
MAGSKRQHGDPSLQPPQKHFKSNAWPIPPYPQPSTTSSRRQFYKNDVRFIAEGQKARVRPRELRSAIVDRRLGLYTLPGSTKDEKIEISLKDRERKGREDPFVKKDKGPGRAGNGKDGLIANEEAFISTYGKGDAKMVKNWLKSGEPGWKPRLGGKNVWKGVKYLGRGGFGVVGLWQREPLKAGEEDQNELYSLPKGVNKVAVKEQDPLEPTKESEYQFKLTETGSKHIVALYRTNEQEKSFLKGLNQPPVVRGFLSMVGAIDAPKRRGMLECLAGGLATMEHGNEKLAGPSWSPKIVHNDNFGLSRFAEVDNNGNDEDEFVAFDDSGEDLWRTGELYVPLIIGYKDMIPRYKVPLRPSSKNQQPLTRRYRNITTTATLFEALPDSPYSVTLRSTVVRMLADKKRDRITSRELLKICRDAKRVCEDADLALNNSGELERWRESQEAREGGPGGWGSLFADEPPGPSRKRK